MRRAGNISVHVIAGDAVEGEPIPRKTVRAADKPPSFDVRAYGAALLAVAAAVGIGELFWRWIRIENVDLLFLLAVVGIAVRFGLWPSLFASVLSGLCYNFFFTPPITRSRSPIRRRSWRSSSSPIVAIVVSNVAARARVQAVAAMARARTTEVALRLQPQARRRRHARRRAVGNGLPDRPDAEGARCPAPPRRTARSQLRPAIRRRTSSMKPISPRPSGLGRTTAPRGAARIRSPARSGCFLPMRTGSGLIGVIGIDSDKPGPLLTPDERRLLDALSDQAALADRAGPSCRGHGPRQAHRRSRAPPHGAAHVDLARSQDPARVRPRSGRHAARSLCRSDRCTASSICLRRSLRNRSGSTGSSPTCST